MHLSVLSTSLHWWHNESPCSSVAHGRARGSRAAEPMIGSAAWICACPLQAAVRANCPGEQEAATEASLACAGVQGQLSAPWHKARRDQRVESGPIGPLLRTKLQGTSFLRLWIQAKARSPIGPEAPWAFCLVLVPPELFSEVHLVPGITFMTCSC